MRNETGVPWRIESHSLCETGVPERTGNHPHDHVDVDGEGIGQGIVHHHHDREDVGDAP